MIGLLCTSSECARRHVRRRRHRRSRRSLVANASHGYAIVCTGHTNPLPPGRGSWTFPTFLPDIAAAHMPHSDATEKIPTMICFLRIHMNWYNALECVGNDMFEYISFYTRFRSCRKISNVTLGYSGVYKVTQIFLKVSCHRRICSIKSNHCYIIISIYNNR